MTFYVVWAGRAPGIYTSWKECEPLVKGYKGARFRSFEDEGVALASYGAGRPLDTLDRGASAGPMALSYSVDASCRGNPGPVEYRGVVTGTGREIFRVGPLAEGTNNIGEFLAVCHALAFCAKRGLEVPVYTDSQTALAWIRHRKCGSALARNAASQETFNLVDRAEKWLASNTWRNPVLQWDTRAWSEIPADFGRKV